MFGGTRKRSAIAAFLAVLVIAVVPATSVAAPAARGGQVVAVASLESGVLADMNAIRLSHGLAPVRINPQLSAAARQHSMSMAESGYFAHNSADGSSFWKRVQNFYAQGKFHYWAVGENLLWSSPDVDASGAMTMWMNSAPHRENLLTARWREVGISAVHVLAAPGTFNGVDVTIITTDFGVRH